MIAAGFDGGMPRRRDDGTVLRRTPAQQTQADTRAAAAQIAQQRKEPVSVGAPQSSTPAAPQGIAPSQQARPEAAPAGQAPKPRQVQFDDDELDVPDFLK